MSESKKSLADKIANLLVTAPSALDPEDEAVDETNAKFIETAADFDETEEELLSKFRKQNIDLLADVDSRYAGKKSSRKTLHDSDMSSEGDIVDDDGSDEEADDASHVTKSDKSNEDNLDDDDDDEDEYEDGSVAEEEDENESEEDPNDHGEMLGNETPDNYKHLKETDTSAHVKKGLCVRNQLNIWENLLEMRIQLQKSVLAANRLPNNEKYSEIKKASGPEFTSKVKETKKSVENLLDKFLLLQRLVLKKYPETKKLHKVKVKPDREDHSGSDEEIPSDTDLSEQSEEEDEQAESPVKKRKLTDFENDISNVNKMYTTYRNGVIQKWHDKTRIVVTKNNASSHSIIHHIEHTLNDKEKLLRKTQLKKGDYKIVGEEEPEENNEENVDKDLGHQYNTEIFDDNDFYHQLLRELIEVKSADVTDPVQLGRQWIQLQNLRSKMKRKIDTRATKGRKIRYAVHTKLVNFMAPIEENSWTDEAKTELYSSLFGQNK